MALADTPSAGPVLRVDHLADGQGLALSGILDMSTEEQARSALQPSLRPGSTLILDLSALEFMDSSGLNVLVAALQVLGPDGRLTLRVPSGIVRKVLALSGLSERTNVVCVPA